MSQTELQNQEPTTAVVSKPKNSSMKALQAYAIIVGFTVVVFIIGVVIGKQFFWNNYSKDTLADKVLQANQQKVAQNPSDPKALTDLGWAYFQKKDVNQALANYKKAIDLDKNYYPAYLNLGIAYTDTKKFDLAIDAYKTAISISPKSTNAHLNLGVVYNLDSKYQEAVDELTIADKASPGSVETMYQLGFAYEKLQKFNEAADEYTGALAYDPKNVQAQEGLNRVKDKVTKK